MKNIKKTFIEYLILFFIGGFIYYLIEIIYRGYSHVSMFILGGICFILIGLINEVFPWDMYIETQISIGLICVLSLEFISGCILNIWLDLHIWDYSNLPFNLLGQICIPFALLWIPLILVAIILDDHVRKILFDEKILGYTSYIIDKIKSYL